MLRTRAGRPLGLEVGFEVLQEMSGACFSQTRGKFGSFLRDSWGPA